MLSAPAWTCAAGIRERLACAQASATSLQHLQCALPDGGVTGQCAAHAGCRIRFLAACALQGGMISSSMPLTGGWLGRAFKRSLA